MWKSENSNSIKENNIDEEFLIGSSRKIKFLKEGIDRKLVSFFAIGVLSFFYVLGELGAAVYLNSLVLLSDGFHNLSDVVSLYIAYWAQKAGKREQSQDMSYGWARTEVLGGLTNGCFLLSLCLYVSLECIPKFIKPEPIESGKIFMITAGVGLSVNIIGTVVFCITGQNHGHSHSHGHGHNKKKETHKHGHKEEGIKFTPLEEPKDELETIKIKKGKKKSEHGDHFHHKKPKRDENVQAVFLHFLGDAISSVMVLIAGALIHYFQGQTWVLYIDPVSSLVIVCIILWTTVPLVKRCSMILLQRAPMDIDVERIRIRLLKIEGVISLHDFHIWQLIDGVVITSVHIGVEEGVDFSNIIDEVKKIFHEYGIHSTSIQPEYVSRSNRKSTEFCEQNCVKECDEDWCCKKSADRKKVELEEYSNSTKL
jgi:zinc transporter 1